MGFFHPGSKQFYLPPNQFSGEVSSSQIGEPQKETTMVGAPLP